jgi:hypothetical protein
VLQSKYSTAGATSLADFALVILEMGFSQTISLGWPRTMILLISAWCLARDFFGGIGP